MNTDIELLSFILKAKLFAFIVAVKFGRRCRTALVRLESALCRALTTGTGGHLLRPLVPAAEAHPLRASALGTTYSRPQGVQKGCVQKGGVQKGCVQKGCVCRRVV